MKKEIRLAFCISLIGAFLFTQCTVVKRRYTKGFYVSTSRKGNQRAIARPAPNQTTQTKIKRENQAPLVTSYKVGEPHVTNQLVASLNKTSKKVFAAKPLAPPDSCGDIITFMDGEELKTKIEEISPDYIGYRRCDHLTGPLIKTAPANIFSIKYSSGMTRVFKHEPTTAQALIANTNYKSTKPMKKSNGLAIAAFITSCFSWLFVPALVAVVLGAASLGQFQKHPEKYKGKWMAVTAIIVGAVLLAIFILALVL